MTASLQGGIASLHDVVPAGTHQLQLKFHYASGTSDFDFTVKTMAPKYASLNRSESNESSKCYTFEDAIGNWDIKNNGVSSNCSKRTPATWWNASNHQPDKEGDNTSSNNQDDTTDDNSNDTLDTTPVDNNDTTDVVEEEEPVPEEAPSGLSQCIQDALANPTSIPDLQTKQQFWYIQNVGVVSCSEGNYLLFNFVAPNAQIAFKATLNVSAGSEGPVGDVDLAGCQGSGSYQCAFQPLVGGQQATVAFPFSGGYGYGTNFSGYYI